MMTLFKYGTTVTLVVVISSCGGGASPAPSDAEPASPTQQPIVQQTAPPSTNTPPPTATPLQPTDTPVPTPTSTPAEVAAEMSESEEPESDPDTPTPEPSDTPTITPTVEQEVDFIIEGNSDLDYAQVIFVKATQSSDGSWRFDTTVRHDDQGWDDYADAWYVVHPDTEEILGERILLHPHDNEQPFTRSQSGIVLPEGLTQVIVRAKDNVEGFGGQEVIVDLTVDESPYFTVSRQ